MSGPAFGPSKRYGGFFRKWMKPMMKEEKSLKEGFEKAFIVLSNPSSSLVE